MCRDRGHDVRHIEMVGQGGRKSMQGPGPTRIPSMYCEPVLYIIHGWSPPLLAFKELENPTICFVKCTRYAAP